MALRVHDTLVADTVLGLTIASPDPKEVPYYDGTSGGPAVRTVQRSPIKRIEVVNVDGADAVYFTVNGDDPEVEGDDTYVIPAAIAARELAVSSTEELEVKLISAGTPQVSVAVASR